MTPPKPYLIRAIYEWIVDNDCTPYVTVNTSIPNTNVPQQYIDNHSITLDISPMSTQQLLMDNEAITCKARFGGIVHNLYIPIAAVAAIYAQENNQGMAFPKEEHNSTQNDSSQSQIPAKFKELKFKVVSGGKE